MIRKVTVDGKERLAIVLEKYNNMENVTEMRNGILEMFEAVFSSDQTKDLTSSEALFFILELYRQMEGGASC